MKDNILVSISCNVYNHSKYLRQTLEGFISQKTNFTFEVLIHDDCSTDGSVEIIQEYAQKYPSIIKPVYETENQYSKGKNIFRSFTLSRVRGKYIAFCEGDDCWIDDHKLAKQVAYMECHPDCTFCFTNGIVENVQTGKKKVFIPYQKTDEKFIKKNGVYNVAELSKISFLPTCSFMVPAANYKRFPNYFWDKCFSGDRRTSLYSASLGYAFYLNDITCCYHYAVSGSALTRRKTKIEVANIERTIVDLYYKLDLFTKRKYHSDFQKAELPYLIWIYCLQGKESLLTENELKRVKKAMKLKDYLKKFVVSNINDSVFNILRALKRGI